MTLVLRLPFDEAFGSSARDTSGNGNHGTIYGATRVNGVYGKALSFDGVDDYASIPITFYGWDAFTIAEWVYAFWPKPNTYWSKFSMIGDYWTDTPSVYHATDNLTEYTFINASMRARKPDGTPALYSYNWFAYRNQWVHIVRQFSLTDRVYRVYINGELKYSTTIPSDYKTILEWNPDTATNPEMYKRFVLGANSLYTEQMKCLSDEVRIYNRALSAQEIGSLYSRNIVTDWEVSYE